MMGTASFAGNVKVVKPKRVKKIESAVACCTVGTFRSCGWAFEPLCDRARALYLMMQP